MVRTHTLRRAAAALAFCAIACLSAPASAQYFGQQQGSVSNLRFPDPEDRALRYLLLSERADGSGHRRAHGRAVASAARAPASARTARPPAARCSTARTPSSSRPTSSAARSAKARAASPKHCGVASCCRSAGPLADTDHVIGHELVHAFQFDMTKEPDGAPGENGAERLPLWFIEGMAEYCRSDRSIPNTAMWLRDAAREENGCRRSRTSTTRSTSRIDGVRRCGRTSAGRWGDEVIGNMLTVAVERATSMPRSSEVLGVTDEGGVDGLAGGHSRTRTSRCSRRDAAERDGHAGDRGQRARRRSQRRAGDQSRWPLDRVSVRRAASSRSICIVADAATGKIVRKLTSTGHQPALLEHPVHLLGGRVGQRQPADRRGDGDVGPRRARDLRRAERRSRTREIEIPDVDEILQSRRGRRTATPSASPGCSAG